MWDKATMQKKDSEGEAEIYEREKMRLTESRTAERENEIDRD